MTTEVNRKAILEMVSQEKSRPPKPSHRSFKQEVLKKQILLDTIKEVDEVIMNIENFQETIPILLEGLQQMREEMLRGNYRKSDEIKKECLGKAGTKCEKSLEYLNDLSQRIRLRL